MRTRLVFAVTALCGATLGIALSTLPPARAVEPGAAAVIADERAGVVKIMIKGQEIARFDENGLQVDGDLTYSGAISDSEASNATQERRRAP